MKRLRRWLFNVLAAVSLFLLAGTGVMWGRSFRVSEYLRTHTKPVVGISDSRGEICVWIDPNNTGYPYDRYSSVRPPNVFDEVHGPFSFQHLGGDTEVLFPHWAFMGTMAIFPAAWLFKKIRRAYVKPAGHCQSCGYDLRATPDRCPECGTAVQAANKPRAT